VYFSRNFKALLISCVSYLTGGNADQGDANGERIVHFDYFENLKIMLFL
jgi:hypothetical protein